MDLCIKLHMTTQNPPPTRTKINITRDGLPEGGSARSSDKLDSRFRFLRADTGALIVATDSTPDIVFKARGSSYVPCWFLDVKCFEVAGK